MKSWFSEHKWYVHVVFGLITLYFLFYACMSLSALISPVNSSPLMPAYATYFSFIKHSIVFLISVSGITGIVLLYRKQKAACFFTLTAIIYILALNLYNSIMEARFLFSFTDMLLAFAMVYLSLKPTRELLHIHLKGYIPPLVMAACFFLLNNTASHLSIQLALWIE